MKSMDSLILKEKDNANSALGHAVTSGCGIIIKHSVLLLFLSLALGIQAKADSITNLAGKVHEPPTTFIYLFQVQEFTTLTNPDGSRFVLDILNGSVITQDGSVGCHPCTTTYINDIFEFLPTESVVLASFGNWNLIGSASGVTLVDPPVATPVATPEPMTLVLIVTGALWAWALSLKTRDAQSREYPWNHPQRK